MSFCVRVCLIWILYGYNWRSFFKILWMDERKRLSSWERPRSDFFWTQPDRISLCVDIFWDLIVNFLPLVDFCPFLVDFINVPVLLNVFTKRVIWNLWGKLLKLNLLRYLAWTVFNDFVSRQRVKQNAFLSIDHTISLIKWNVILFSINPEKHRIISLILAELLTSKWDTFITRHPVDRALARTLSLWYYVTSCVFSTSYFKWLVLLVLFNSDILLAMSIFVMNAARS